MTKSTLGTSTVLALAARVGGAGLALTTTAAVAGRAFVGAGGQGLLQPFDDAVRAGAQSDLGALTGLASAVATIGESFVILAAAAFTSLRLRSQGPSRALLALLAVLIAGAVGAVTKILVARPRPTGLEVGLFEQYSFPSGHTVSATAFGTALYLLWRSKRARHNQWRGIAALAVAVFVVAAGRIVINAHWATDVIAGALIGLASTAISRWALAATFTDDLT